jgi:hypothetical protein
MRQVLYVNVHVRVIVYGSGLVHVENIHIIHTPVLQGKRSTIRTYLEEIQMSLGNIRDEGALDHVLAKLLPVVTSLRTQVAQPADEQSTLPASFIKTEAFTPAEKNETQWRFHKVKTAGRIKTKFPMKYERHVLVYTHLHVLCVTLKYRHPSKEEQIDIQHKLDQTAVQKNVCILFIPQRQFLYRCIIQRRHMTHKN